MSISIGDNSLYTASLTDSQKSTSASKIENTLSKDLTSASDEEMLEACKDFESYLVQEVVKEVKKTLASSEEDENQYVSYFGDMMYEKIADQITDSGELGIANQLYQAMKRN